MNDTRSFQQAFDEAIDALATGERLDDVLTRHARHGDELRPLLETVMTAREEGARHLPEMRPRLAENFAVLRAAVEREQIARREQVAPAPPPARTPWWQRRLTFASVSLPAGIFALLAFAGIGGAAAAASIATGAIPSLPEAMGFVVSDDENDGDNVAPVLQPAASATAPKGPPTEAPGYENRPTSSTYSGTVSKMRGNVFTLVTSEGDFTVTVDGKTTVSGAIEDGATATVTGDRTATRNLRAESVEVTAAAPIQTQPTLPPGRTRTPGPPDTTGNPSGPPPNAGNAGR